MHVPGGAFYALFLELPHGFATELQRTDWMPLAIYPLLLFSLLSQPSELWVAWPDEPGVDQTQLSPLFECYSFCHYVGACSDLGDLVQFEDCVVLRLTLVHFMAWLSHEGTPLAHFPFW